MENDRGDAEHLRELTLQENRSGNTANFNASTSNEAGANGLRPANQTSSISQDS